MPVERLMTDEYTIYVKLPERGSAPEQSDMTGRVRPR
jgi:hypothetical protein